MTKSKLLALTVGLLALSACDSADHLLGTFQKDRNEKQVVDGPRRVPMLNPKPGSYVQQLALQPRADVQREMSAEPLTAPTLESPPPAPVVSAPAPAPTQEASSDFGGGFMRWFKSGFDNPNGVIGQSAPASAPATAQDAHSERKPLPGNIAMTGSTPATPDTALNPPMSGQPETYALAQGKSVAYPHNKKKYASATSKKRRYAKAKSRKKDVAKTEAAKPTVEMADAKKEEPYPKLTDIPPTPAALNDAKNTAPTVAKELEQTRDTTLQTKTHVESAPFESLQTPPAPPAPPATPVAPATDTPPSALKPSEPKKEEEKPAMAPPPPAAPAPPAASAPAPVVPVPQAPVAPEPATPALPAPVMPPPPPPPPALKPSTGGKESQNGPVSVAESISPVQSHWTREPRLPEARYQLRSMAVAAHLAI